MACCGAKVSRNGLFRCGKNVEAATCGCHKANVGLVPFKKLSDERGRAVEDCGSQSKEDFRGCAGAGVETDFLALYAHRAWQLPGGKWY
jgi:hypothetical protein